MLHGNVSVLAPALQYSTVQYSTVQYSKYSTVQYSTVQYSKYSTVPVLFDYYCSCSNPILLLL